MSEEAISNMGYYDALVAARLAVDRGQFLVALFFSVGGRRETGPWELTRKLLCRHIFIIIHLSIFSPLLLTSRRAGGYCA